MQLGWLESLIYGLISGLTELLPVSSHAHQIMLCKIFGAEGASTMVDLSVHIATLLALVMGCRPQLQRFQRAQRLARIPKRRRKKQPDPVAMLDIRLLKGAVIPILFSFLLFIPVRNVCGKLSISALLLVLNGLFLYIPQFLAGANKDSRSMSGLDSLLLGLSGALGILPGVSRMGTTLSVASVRGADRKSALNWAVLLSIPAMIAMILVDFVTLFTAGSTAVTAAAILPCILAGATAYLGALAGLTLMRFLSVNAGFSGFAYYSWGIALLSFLLYLTI